MVRDQAEVLRKLVQQSGSTSADGVASAAPILAVVGGKGGVGTSTIALNLAVELARHNQRVVLVDFDVHSADIAARCRLEGQPNLADVIAGRRRFGEILRRGPSGIRVATGPSAFAQSSPEVSDASVPRLLDSLRAEDLDTERIVIDAGCAGHRDQIRWLCGVDHVLLVTTPDPVSIMDSYGAVKRLVAARPSRLSVSHVVNLVASPFEAEEIHDRFARSCWRFLAVEIPLAGSVPVDSAVVAASRARQSLMSQSRGSPAARRITALSERVEHLAAWPTASDPRPIAAAAG